MFRKHSSNIRRAFSGHSLKRYVLLEETWLVRDSRRKSKRCRSRLFPADFPCGSIARRVIAVEWFVLFVSEIYTGAPIPARSRRSVQDASHNSQAADNGVVSDGLGHRSPFLRLRQRRGVGVQGAPEVVNYTVYRLFRNFEVKFCASREVPVGIARYFSRNFSTLERDLEHLRGKKTLRN